MKRILFVATAFVLFVTLAFSTVAAEPGDYGYYDKTGDGKIELVDVLDVLCEMLNSDSDVNLIRVLRTLKITTTCEVVNATVKTMDYDSKTATLFYDEDIEVKMSFAQLGLDNVPNIAFYEQGTVTMSVPTPAADFFANYNASSVYAAAVDIKYDMNILEATIGNVNAKLNGEANVLHTAPVVHNGIIMFPIRPIIELVEAKHSFDEATKTIVVEAYGTTLEMTVDATEAYVNGEKVDAPSMLVLDTAEGAYTFFPLEFVAEVFGATVVFDEDTQTITVMQQFHPTVYLSEVSGTAGEDVAVTAYIKHNPGIAGFEFRISYDSNAMAYVSGKSENGNFYIATSTTAGANPVKVVGANLSLKNVTGDLKLATVTFTIAADTTSGKHALTIDGFKAYDADIIELRVKTENSDITVN